MRPRLPASLTDLAWLVGLVPLAIFDGLFLWWGMGIACAEAQCPRSFGFAAAAWAAGLVAALATFWSRQTRPLLACATAALLVPVVRFAAVLAS